MTERLRRSAEKGFPDIIELQILNGSFVDVWISELNRYAYR